MKIAILTNAFPPDGRGGAERIALLQANALRERGHEVGVWAPESPVASRESPDGQQIEVTRFKSRFQDLAGMSLLRRLFWHLFEDIGENKEIVDGVALWNPDILITHNLTGCGMETPSVIVKRIDCAWVHVLHDVQLTDPSGQIRLKDADRGRAWRGFWSWYRRSVMFKTPDVLVSPTNWLLAWHKNYGFKGTRELVIPNPVAVHTRRSRDFKKPYTLAYVGRLTEDKGFDVFIGLTGKLDSDLVGKYLVIGDGPLKKEMDRIHYLGSQSPDETRKIIGEADLLVAPSQILENQQTILLEAMSEGTPIVATDVGGTRETLAGTVCPVVHADEIAQTVFVLLSHPDRLIENSETEQDNVKKHELGNYIELLSSILTGLKRS